MLIQQMYEAQGQQQAQTFFVPQHSLPAFTLNGQTFSLQPSAGLGLQMGGPGNYLLMPMTNGMAMAQDGSQAIQFLGPPQAQGPQAQALQTASPPHMQGPGQEAMVPIQVTSTVLVPQSSFPAHMQQPFPSSFSHPGPSQLFSQPSAFTMPMVQAFSQAPPVLPVARTVHSMTEMKPLGLARAQEPKITPVLVSSPGAGPGDTPAPLARPLARPLGRPPLPDHNASYPPHEAAAERPHRVDPARSHSMPLGAVAPVFKRCGRRPQDLTPEQFEAVYGPSPTLLRVCIHCGCDNTQTAQFRKGPDGLNTLCNSCGKFSSLSQCLDKKNIVLGFVVSFIQSL